MSRPLGSVDCALVRARRPGLQIASANPLLNAGRQGRSHSIERRLTYLRQQKQAGHDTAGHAA